jgi:hypothetical protein
MQGNFSRACLLIFAFAVSPAVVAHAQLPVIPLVAVAAERTVAAILDDFQKTADRLLQDAQNTGNAEIATAGNAMNVAIRNANIALADQRSAFFRDLVGPQANFFTQLNNEITTINKSLGRAVSVVQATDLNLTKLMNQLPFSEKMYFRLFAIHGLVQVHSPDADYDVDITGLGFGAVSPPIKYDIDVDVNGTRLGSGQIHRIAHVDPASVLDTDSMRVIIPNAILENLFDDANSGMVKLVIHQTATVPRLFGLYSTTQTQDWPVTITLLPRKPITITGQEYFNTTTTVPDPSSPIPRVAFFRKGQCSKDNVCTYFQDVGVANDKHIIGVDTHCTGQCGWCWNPETSGGVGAKVTGNNAHIAVACNGDAQDTTVSFDVKFVMDSVLVATRTIVPVQANYHQSIKIPMSAANTLCSYRLDVKYSTGQHSFIDSNMTSSVDSYIVRQSSGISMPAPCQPVFAAGTP